MPLGLIGGECSSPPTFIEGRTPIFPPTRMATFDPKNPGMARVKFTVTTDGRVKNARVIEASHPQYAAGIGAVLPTWRFLPATLNGKPVEVEVETAWTFILDF